MSKKLIIALSVALISSKGANAAQTHLPDATLDRLEVLAAENDLSGVQNFIAGHQELTRGDTPLALALRMIMNETLFGSGALDFDVVANRGRGKGRGYVPWSERPGKGRKVPPPKHPHIY